MERNLRAWNRRYSAIIVAGIIALTLSGCTSSTPPPQSPIVPLPQGTYNYSLTVSNIRPLDTAVGQYVLWLKMINDTTWYFKPLTYWTSGVGSLDFLGTLQLPRTPDSIEMVYVSMEPMILPPAPSHILMTGAFHPVADSAALSSTNAQAIGDYSRATATVIFTTKSSDTNRARSEFYFMDFVHGVPSPTGKNFPLPPAGWSYGLWVLDSNFYPLHKFFYGAFRNADSSDFNPQNEEFPFPGGYNPAPLNDPGARLEVTLEPNFRLTTNRPPGPSPFTVLWVRLRQFISLNDTLALHNAWSSSAPQGTLTISR